MPVEDRRLPSYACDNLLRRIFQQPEKMVSRFLSPGEVAADLGCGPGYFTLPMARLVGPKGKVFAVDFDEKTIEKVKEKASEHGLENVIDSRASSAADINFIPDESVDFVLAEGLLCCMIDHAGAVRQIKRVLKKDGRAHLSISRFAMRGDRRAVTKEEWKRMLESFRTLESGHNLFSRWALVSKFDGEVDARPPESSEKCPNHLGCVCN